MDQGDAMPKLIVNADDFGLSKEINKGICEAHLRGVVTDTSLLVRSPYAREALRTGTEAGIPIGIHVDLVTPFVQERSHFLGPFGRVCQELFRREFARVNDGKFSCEELICIRNEIRSQIDDFTAWAGKPPSHLDYHFGLHYLPEVMAIYLTLAEEHRNPVRWGKQYAGVNPYPLAPDCLRDQFRGRERDGVESFLGLLDQPWDGVLEIICHPGYSTPGNLPDAYNHQREYELRTLTDPRLKTGIQDRGIELVTYNWLKSL
jgi:predicted glycoside hydrolase/deacetylase ChbG (UPF0249 family)